MGWIALGVMGVAVMLFLAWVGREMSYTHEVKDPWKRELAVMHAADFGDYEGLTDDDREWAESWHAANEVARQCTVSPQDDIGRPEGGVPWVCMAAELHLTPLGGSYAPTIEVVEGCKVTGERGHIQVYERLRHTKGGE